MVNYRNLKPHVRVIEFVGGTGNGKTEIATVPANPEARKILIQGVGNTNSTLNERLIVYTNEYTDRIVIAVKHEKNAFTRNQYTEILCKSIAQIIKLFGKNLTSTKEKDEEALEESLKTQLQKKNNIKATLSLLEDEQIEKFVKGIVALYQDFNLHQYNYHIYNTVKNNLSEGEVKENSKKFLAAIQQEVEHTMDMQNDNFKNALWDIWAKLNQNLSNVFFNYFTKENISKDGYYYKEILLNNPDMDFIGAMFTANNIQAGQKLSLEVLCSEIVIYVPMNEIFCKLIEENTITNKVFQDSLGHIMFGILDTRGLYHADNTDDENEDYCSELLYKGDVDAIAMVVPLEGDTNEKKIGELYRDVLKNFTKQIPVFMIHNKLDLYVSALLKQDFDNPLSLDSFDDKVFSKQDLLKSITSRMTELNDDLMAVQLKAKKRLPIKSLACYLKRDASFPKELILDFNVRNVYDTMLKDIAKSLKDSADKIKLCVEEGEIPNPIVDTACLAELIHIHVTDNITYKKVFSPGMSDIALSIGKTPHGNSYNALHRRLKNGDGYTSNIDESYFYNCQSFSVKFTANLRNFASSEFIHSIVYKSLKIQGVKYNQQENERFMKTVERYVNSKELVVLLLYYKAMLDAEQKAFSFKGKFQNFLQNSMLYFDPTQIDEKAYTVAIKTMILEAANKALDLNVTFR